MTTNKKYESFFEQVFAITRAVPYGRVTTYGAIAKCMSTSQSSRMVGWALNGSHNTPDIPAHRVVNRNGLLTGKSHFKTETEMQELLESEGVCVKNNQIQNFEQLFWDPMRDL